MRKLKQCAALILALSISAAALAGCTADSAAASKNIDLNSMSVDQLAEKAKSEGDIQSIGMPDSWANWGQTWNDLKSKYSLTHTDADMSSSEELALFEAEKNKPTKDIGDVGQSFGPVAVEKGLTLPYKTTSWDKIPDWAKDTDGNWIIGYYGTMAMITNTDKVKEAPKSWQDIKNGTYKVNVGDVTKATQSQNAVLAAAIAFGGDETNIQPGIDFFAELASKGRLDMGDATMARLEKGDVDVVLSWDFLSLGNRELLKSKNANVNYDIHIPSDGSVQSGYCTVINKYAPHPYAAALAREYILSDEGQINLARGYAKPIRSDVKLPDDVKSKLIPDEEYAKARPIKDFDAWGKTVAELPEKWQNDVLSKVK